ncbi:hypothetical protein DL93DRAFT_726464 [Clavulina sp. PMI_390]|nr:hypothetical protein DL93DRAFT_726464 [Clavulina sp. PMI_390]
MWRACGPIIRRALLRLTSCSYKSHHDGIFFSLHVLSQPLRLSMCSSFSYYGSAFLPRRYDGIFFP